MSLRMMCAATPTVSPRQRILDFWLSLGRGCRERTPAIGATTSRGLFFTNVRFRGSLGVKFSRGILGIEAHDVTALRKNNLSLSGLHKGRRAGKRRRCLASRGKFGIDAVEEV
jgi:hypothetical protein